MEVAEDGTGTMARTADLTIDRRDFLRLAAAGAGALALTGWPTAVAGAGGSALQGPGLEGTVAGLAVTRAGAVAVGEDPAGRAAVWTVDATGAWRSSAAPPAAARLADVTAVPDGFVAVGSIAGRAAWWRSGDGSSWTAGPELPQVGELRSVAASRGGVLAAGALSDGETTESAAPLLLILERSGGWGELSTAGIGELPHGGLTAVARHAGRWVVAGLTVAGSSFWTSGADGWTRRPDGATEPVAWSSLLTVGREIVALGTAASDGRVHVARSLDAGSWRLGDVPGVLADLGPELRAAEVDPLSGLLSATGGPGALVRAGLR